MLEFLVSNILTHHCAIYQISFESFNVFWTLVLFDLFQNIKPLKSYLDGEEVSALPICVVILLIKHLSLGLGQQRDIFGSNDPASSIVTPRNLSIFSIRFQGLYQLDFTVFLFHCLLGSSQDLVLQRIAVVRVKSASGFWSEVVSCILLDVLQLQIKEFVQAFSTDC